MEETRLPDQRWILLRQAEMILLEAKEPVPRSDFEEIRRRYDPHSV
jgi:hypothetical protein